MTLEVEFDEPRRFDRLVRRVNQSPIMWTVGLLIPTYIVAFSIAFMALVSDPYIESPLMTFILLLISSVLVMGYHWFMSRYQRSSNLGQLIQLGLGLAPVVGGFCIFVMSIMRVS